MGIVKNRSEQAVELMQKETIYAPAVTFSSADFAGVNWADERDNFVDDNLILSGTSSNEDYATIQLQAQNILNGFKAAGANTVRLPINPPTVLGSWWQKYKAAIDEASALDMKVVLAYWEAGSSKDGMIDNALSFWAMWDSVTTTYSSKGNIYFEVFNEPHGYSVTDLSTIYARFLLRYPKLPKARIILDGAGYATDVNSIGSDKRFDTCLLSFHYYTWFDGNKQTTADWEQPVNSLAYPSRTIVTEFGVPMINDKDYLSAPGTDVEVAYFQGMTNAIHSSKIGGIYWPGLRTNDSYSVFTLSGSTIQTKNTTGLTRLKYAWNQTELAQPYAKFTSGAYYKVINKNSGKSLDIDNGAAVIQWDYVGGNNQQWQFNSVGNGIFSIINKNSNKALDIDSASVSAGKNIVQEDYTDSTNQQWQIIDIGFGYYKVINKKSGLALDVNGQSIANGGNLIQWYWNSDANQQWQITGL